MHRWTTIFSILISLMTCIQVRAQIREMAIHTNLLYDSFFIPNVGMDIDLGRGWTAGLNYHHAWWTDHLFYWKQTYGGDIHVDRYLSTGHSNKPFDGHRLGVYGQQLTYDIEFGGDGQMAAKPNYAIGLEYGYMFSLGRNLHLDFVLGFGYLWGEYKKYAPMWNEYPAEWHYVWQSTHQRKMCCPTKAEINLVWVIDKKGGRK